MPSVQWISLIFRGIQDNQGPSGFHDDQDHRSWHILRKDSQGILLFLSVRISADRNAKESNIGVLEYIFPTKNSIFPPQLWLVKSPDQVFNNICNYSFCKAYLDVVSAENVNEWGAPERITTLEFSKCLIMVLISTNCLEQSIIFLFIIMFVGVS